MSRRVIDLGLKSGEVTDKDIPIALIYFGRFVVRDWSELFFAAIKCLYLEYPETIQKLCGTDSGKILFLRTNTIDMKRPKRIAPIIFLETDRTPSEILTAIRTVFYAAGVLNIGMKIEVTSPEEDISTDLEKIFSPPLSKSNDLPEKIPAPKIIEKPKMPEFHSGQSISEMLAALDAMPPLSPKHKIPVSTEKSKSGIEAEVFGSLFFNIGGKLYGPFSTEKNRYVALMKCLAENFPKKFLSQAGKHINSLHRLTLAQGRGYMYFEEPVNLPNNFCIDKGFPDKVLFENEQYYLKVCGLNFSDVIF